LTAAVPEPDNSRAPGVLEEREWQLAWQPPFLDALARLPNVSAACRAAGISRQRAYEIATVDEGFRVAWTEAFEVGLDLREQIVDRRGTTGEERRILRTRTKRDAQGTVIETETTVTEETYVSDAMLLATLRAHRPEKWGERVDHRHGGSATGVPIQVELGARQRSPEHLAELLTLWAEQHGVAVAVVEEDGVERLALEPPSENGDVPA
jgi:hypothetical protein